VSVASKAVKSAAWYQDVNEEWNSPVDPACVGVSENLAPENLLHLATDLGFMHLCQKQGHAYEKEVEAAKALIGAEESYLEFPASVVLSPEKMSAVTERGLICMDRQFNSSQQKREVLEELTKVAQSKGLSQTVIDDALAVADEMFTNAIYNAPFVDPQTTKNPGINRQCEEVTLSGGKFGRLFLANDEQRLLIGCSDPYGSLDLKRYLNKIKATYVRGPAATMNFGPGGAGIGSYIIFNAGASLYFGVWPGHATVLCCVIPLGISNRKRMQLPKHLHWIQR
jgi:hypothetical protein